MVYIEHLKIGYKYDIEQGREKSYFLGMARKMADEGPFTFEERIMTSTCCGYH